MSGTARLWDQHFNLLATETSGDPTNPDDSTIEVAIRGKGAMYNAVKAAMPDSLDLHLTYDPDPDNLDDWRHRIGGKVTKLTFDNEHICECGNRVTTTTITAADFDALSSRYDRIHL